MANTHYTDEEIQHLTPEPAWRTKVRQMWGDFNFWASMHWKLIAGALVVLLAIVVCIFSFSSTNGNAMGSTTVVSGGTDPNFVKMQLQYNEANAKMIESLQTQVKLLTQQLDLARKASSVDPKALEELQKQVDKLNKMFADKDAKVSEIDTKVKNLSDQFASVLAKFNPINSAQAKSGPVQTAPTTTAAPKALQNDQGEPTTARWQEAMQNCESYAGLPLRDKQMLARKYENLTQKRFADAMAACRDPQGVARKRDYYEKQLPSELRQAAPAEQEPDQDPVQMASYRAAPLSSTEDAQLRQLLQRKSIQLLGPPQAGYQGYRGETRGHQRTPRGCTERRVHDPVLRRTFVRVTCR